MSDLTPEEIREKEKKIVRPLRKEVNDHYVKKMDLKKGTKLYANELGEMYYLQHTFGESGLISYVLMKYDNKTRKKSRLKSFSLILSKEYIRIIAIANLNPKAIHEVPTEEEKGRMLFRIMMEEAIRIGKGKKIEIFPGSDLVKKHFKGKFGFNYPKDSALLENIPKGPKIKHHPPR
jgi:hypothetical protein